MTEVIVYHAYTAETNPKLSGKFLRVKEELKKYKPTLVNMTSLLSFRLASSLDGIHPYKSFELRIKRLFLSEVKLYTRFARWLAFAALLVTLVTYGPSMWFEAKALVIGDQTSKILAQAAGNPDNFSGKAVQRSPYQPPQDPTLPIENYISISSIGVDTMINEATKDNHEDALREGIWRVSDFGTPYRRNVPTILSAHRFGYLKWSNTYRRENSFYNLGKLEVGDTVEIVWRQRKYTYEVYAQERGEEISDYNADLILYTCESLNSPVRITKYAKLLRI